MFSLKLTEKLEYLKISVTYFISGPITNTILLYINCKKSPLKKKWKKSYQPYEKCCVNLLKTLIC